MNIFDNEQQKLQNRAIRFALKPDEIHNFTDADLSELYDSLGIIEHDENVIFKALHVLGTAEMSVKNLLEYFANYAPSEIEWIDNNSCNVIWLENISAARAMFYNSKAVRGMPTREPVDTFAREFSDNIEEALGKSILLRDREIELKVDVLLQKHDLKNAVDISEIKIPIPPGYWRLGKNHPKAKCLLLRFGLKTDKKPYKIDNLGKYYRKLGTKMLVTDNKNKEVKKILPGNKKLSNEKNPWGVIAKNWDKDAKFREPEYKPESKKNRGNISLQIHLGKRKDNEEETLPSVVVESNQKSDCNSKVNILRMRMYADEEEEKLRRRKILQTIKHTEKLSYRPSLGSSDLRNVLCFSNKIQEEVIKVDSESEEGDLKGTLMSKTRQIVYNIERKLTSNHHGDSRYVMFFMHGAILSIKLK